MDEVTQAPLFLCVEKHGTPFECITNWNLARPVDGSTPRMWLDWSAIMATLTRPDRPDALKVIVLSAYAETHELSVISLPSEDFYQKFPESDPRTKTAT